MDTTDFKTKWQTLCIAILKTISEFDEDISVGFACNALDDAKRILKQQADQTSVKRLKELQRKTHK